MPSKMCGQAVQLPAAGYQQLDTINGMCDVTYVNQTNGSTNIVADAGDATEAATAESSGLYAQAAAVGAAVHKLRLNPSRTWIKWNGTTVGTNRHNFLISW